MPLISSNTLHLDTSYQYRSTEALFDAYFGDEGGTTKQSLSDAIHQLMRGEYVNVSEQRKVTHPQTRSYHAVVTTNRRDTRFADTVRKLRSGIGWAPPANPSPLPYRCGWLRSWPQHGLVRAKRICYDHQSHRLDVHFVSSMDGGCCTVLPIIDPETTVFIIASKSFSTIDTLANVNTVREWIKPQLNGDQWLQHHDRVLL